MLINPKWVLSVIHEHEESVCKKNPRKLRLDPSETRGVRGIIVAKLIVIRITCKFYAKKIFFTSPADSQPSQLWPDAWPVLPEVWRRSRDYPLRYRTSPKGLHSGCIRAGDCVLFFP